MEKLRKKTFDAVTMQFIDGKHGIRSLIQI